MKIYLSIIIGFISGIIMFFLYDLTLFNLTPKLYTDLNTINTLNHIIIVPSINNYLISCNIEIKETIIYKQKSVIIYKQNCEVKK